jgi:hypothetical protein
VHHKDGDKRNFKRSNLEKLGHQQHGWVSAKQHYVVSVIMEERERRWYEEFDMVTA